MLENAVNNLIKNIEFLTQYALANSMILVRVDVPANIYFALQECCHNLKPLNKHITPFDIEQIYQVPIDIKAGIKKPQYIMEMINNDF